MERTHTTKLEESRAQQLAIAMDKCIRVVNSLLLDCDGTCACRDGDLCAYHADIYNHLLAAGKEIRQAIKSIQQGAQ